MTDKKGWGSTVAGWFIERDEPALPDSAASGDVPEPPAPATENYTSPSPTQSVFQTAPPPPTAGQVDFPAVFSAAGVDQDEQQRVARTTDLLRSLPAGTDAAVKKQIVEASLKAFGYPVEQIIEAGAQEIQALEVYIQAGQRDTQSLLAESQKRTAELEAEIARIKKVMEDQVASQYALTQACNQQKLKVQEVLEFFGQEAVARVVSQSPKLHEPKTGA